MHNIHHLHTRQRAQLATYPHPNPWVARLDKLLIFVAVIAPMMTIPQIYKILSTGTAAGVSPVTWGCFAFFNIPWLLYGIVHKAKPIMIAYTGWLIVNTTVTALAIVYG